MLLSLLTPLVQFRTISSDHAENERALRWIVRQMRSVPVRSPIMRANGFPSLLVIPKNIRAPKLWLAAHLDVVPGPVSAFRPVMRGGKFYGRGAFDMKFAIACYLRLFQELRKDIARLPVGIMITTDEELGGQNGTPRLLPYARGAHVCVLPDGGNGWSFEVGAKGALQYAMESRGTSAHGSRTWLGENAITKLSLFLQALSHAFRKEPCGDKKHWHSTMNVGQIAGGAVANQIPDHASALLDIRYTDHHERTRIERSVARLLKNFPGVIAKQNALGESFRMDTQNPHLLRFMQIARERFGIQPTLLLSHGSSDARYWSAGGVPVIATRPRGGGHHSDREWIALRDLERFYVVLREFVYTFS